MEIKRFALKDMFTIGRIIKNVDFSEVEFKPEKNQQDYALEACGCLLNSIDKCEKEVYTLLSSITGLTIKEVEDLDWEEVVNIVYKIIEINDIEKVFTQAKGLIQK